MQEESTTGLPSEMPAGKQPLQSERDPQEEGVKRKQARKRKHVEGDIGHLQRQMQASGVFGRDENAGPSDPEDISESEMGDSASETSETTSLDPSDKAVISRAAERAKLPFQATSTSTSVFDRGPQRRKSEGLPILPDFITELQSSWKAPSSTGLPKTQLGNLAGAATYGLAAAPQIGPTFAMLAGAMTRTGRDATHPSKQGRIVDSQLRKAYHASALSARLACTNSLLLVYLESMLQDLSSTLTEGESIPEALRVVDMLIRGTSAHAQALGQSMANIVQARRQIWLSQANLLDQDCMAVTAAPLVPGEVFGPPAEAALGNAYTALIPLRRQGLRIANYLDDWRQSVLKECLSEFLKKEQVTVMLGRRLLGLMAAASQVEPLGLLHMRPLQRWLAKYKASPYENGQRMIPRDQDCLPAVKWWLSTPGLKEGVPIGLPNGLKQLRLAYNHIEKISAGAFQKLENLTLLLLQGLGVLNLLDLSHNLLETFPKHLPPSVQQLYLSNNSLTGLTEDSLHGFNRLRYLRLGHNKLRNEGLDPGAFNLTSLVELDLSYNQLTEIPTVPTTLQYLYLEVNHIQVERSWVSLSDVHLRFSVVRYGALCPI
ncbi:lumican-like protein [Labeo rohita]|uniref:Lumican-like protein n=1 Tax=Labeo rohita TaxID=84645 RepID=A0A498MLW2_LABRO|nr:lumican-like protein [Labeo rohita]